MGLEVVTQLTPKTMPGKVAEALEFASGFTTDTNSLIVIISCPKTTPKNTTARKISWTI